MIKKFRVWSKSKNRFLSGILITEDGLVCHIEKYEEFSLPKNQDDFTIQQWTGLTDSQGVEIYEGDIVEQVFHSVFSTTYEKDGKLIPVYPIGWRFEVKYRRYKMSPFDLSAENDFKVIGNIFQNPELLEKS